MFVQDGFLYLIVTRHKLTVWWEARYSIPGTGNRGYSCGRPGTPFLEPGSDSIPGTGKRGHSRGPFRYPIPKTQNNGYNGRDVRNSITRTLDRGNSSGMPGSSFLELRTQRLPLRKANYQLTEHRKGVPAVGCQVFHPWNMVQR